MQLHKRASLQNRSWLWASLPLCCVHPQLRVFLPPTTFPIFQLCRTRWQKRLSLSWWPRRSHQTFGTQHKYSAILKTSSLLIQFWATQTPTCAFPSSRSPRSILELRFPVFFALAGASGRVVTLLGPSSILHAGARGCPSTCPLNLPETQ